jgi:hypothetical protein
MIKMKNNMKKRLRVMNKKKVAIGQMNEAEWAAMNNTMVTPPVPITGPNHSGPKGRTEDLFVLKTSSFFPFLDLDLNPVFVLNRVLAVGICRATLLFPGLV